ncbi:MAG: 30S ribosome-binding factor RbfA [Betaproteobacteria bacterium]|nr:30S ribosome-binding factor RbfA [Betaproteobacteria bacterium]
MTRSHARQVHQSHQGFSRKDRINEQIRRELAALIDGELKDPRIGMISLTAVDISADYAHAKIYFSTLAAEDAQILAGLNAAAGFLRRELGRRVRLHTTPELHFVRDISLERGAELSRLIDEAVHLSGESESANRISEGE